MLSLVYCLVFPIPLINMSRDSSGSTVAGCKCSDRDSFLGTDMNLSVRTRPDFNLRGPRANQNVEASISNNKFRLEQVFFFVVFIYYTN
jgi:hypothetical protein